MTVPKVRELDQIEKFNFQKMWCSHTRAAAANTHNQKDQKCKRVAIWMLDDVPFCTHHAGQRVLVALAKKENNSAGDDNDDDTSTAPNVWDAELERSSVDVSNHHVRCGCRSCQRNRSLDLDAALEIHGAVSPQQTESEV
jgi:hypothetical protein